ncbi:hypothetical protein JW868_02820, partial [Candidatus Woesearchaeota archaeon]|nr:hypothetical protein [Candidatus Woesearchaeota archaeon]
DGPHQALLQQGTYTLVFRFRNTEQEEADWIGARVTFEVFTEPTAVNMTSPIFGVGTDEDFDLLIWTDDEATCSYTSQDSPPQNLLDNAYPPLDFLFTDMSSNYHVAFDIADHINSLAPNTLINDTNTGESPDNPDIIIVKCVNVEGEITIKDFEIGIDPSPSNFTVSFDPPIVVDKFDSYSVMTVESNDRVSCYFTETRTPTAVWLEGQDPAELLTYGEKRNAYLFSPNITINYSDFSTQYDAQLFNYTVTCTNLAQDTVTERGVEHVVHIQNQPTINLIQPLSTCIDDNTPEVIVETDIWPSERCQIEVSEGTWAQMAGDEITHEWTYQFQTLAEGSYSYTVRCKDMVETLREVRFTIDRTAPTNNTVEALDQTCSLTGIHAKLDAVDSTCGLAGYEVLVKHGNDVIFEDNISSGGGLNVPYVLVENDTYSIQSWAFDGAGNKVGTAATASIKATDSNSVSCDFVPPTGSITRLNMSEESVTFRVNCHDSESGCDPTYNYGTSAYNETCEIDTPKNLGENHTIYSSVRFCYMVYDLNSNNFSDTELIPIVDLPDHCLNYILDGGESDIDCGDGCLPCDAGLDCDFDSDCLSNSCINGTCELASCSDGVKNGEEAGIDCGVACSVGCDIGNTCLQDADCFSRWCDRTSLTCANPSCEDSIKNGFETDVDCGGICDACDLGKACLTDSDCKSGICDDIMKACSNSQGSYPNDDTPRPNTGDDCLSGDCDGESQGTPWGGIILLIIGILLAVAGAGYIVYVEKGGTDFLSFSKGSEQDKGTLGQGASRRTDLSGFTREFKPSEEKIGRKDLEVIKQAQKTVDPTKPIVAEPQLTPEQKKKIETLRSTAAKRKDAIRRRQRKKLFETFEK